MKIIAYLALATSITVICLYIVEYSLWWAFAVPAAALAMWCCRGSAHTHSVPSHRGRTTDERTSLLRSHFRLPTETSSRVASSQSSYTSRSSFGGTPSVLHTVPGSSFRVVVDPGLLRYSTPTVAVDPRLLRYTVPSIPSPAVVETRRILHLNLTSTPLMAAAERQLALARAARNSSQLARYIPASIPASIPAPVARREIDGLFLHEAVEAEVNDRYPYDQQIKTKDNPYAKRSVKGNFKCYACKSYKHQLRGPHTWHSNMICVEIWMSSSGHRYRTRLHSQMCKKCNRFVEPGVIKDDYVTMVVKVLDRWTGQNSEVKPRQKFLKTGPHKIDKCNACLKGICLVKPAQKHNS